MKPRPRIVSHIDLAPNGVRVMAIARDGSRRQRTLRGAIVNADWAGRSFLAHLERQAGKDGAA